MTDIWIKKFIITALVVDLQGKSGEKPKWKKYVSSFKGNWMESTELADQLQKLGVKNAIYLPNFKKLSLMTETELRKEYDEPYKLCTFSRVMKEKGIEDAIEAVREINDEYQRKVVSLDIYGPAEESYMVHLNELLGQNADCRYRGVIPANESVEALRDYYALLFRPIGSMREFPEPLSMHFLLEYRSLHVDGSIVMRC